MNYVQKYEKYKQKYIIMKGGLCIDHYIIIEVYKNNNNEEVLIINIIQDVYEFIEELDLDKNNRFIYIIKIFHTKLNIPLIQFITDTFVDLYHKKESNKLELIFDVEKHQMLPIVNFAIYDNYLHVCTYDMYKKKYDVQYYTDKLPYKDILHKILLNKQNMKFKNNLLNIAYLKGYDDKTNQITHYFNYKTNEIKVLH